MRIYSTKGKEIPTRHGMTLGAGVIVNDGGKFTTVEKESILVIRKGEWDDTRQARDQETWEIIPVLIP
jgi:hypothetical protein